MIVTSFELWVVIDKKSLNCSAIEAFPEPEIVNSKL
jgi:hypothetical protein